MLQREISFLNLLHRNVRFWLFLLLFITGIVQLSAMYIKLNSLPFTAEVTDPTAVLYEEEETITTLDYAPSFHQCIEELGYNTIYLVCFIVGAAALCFQYVIMQRNSRSNYTLLRLHLTVKRQFFLLLLHNLIHLLYIVSAQIIIIFFSFLMYRAMVPEVLQQSNELWKAYVNGSYLRFLFPATSIPILLIALSFYASFAVHIGLMTLLLPNRTKRESIILFGVSLLIYYELFKCSYRGSYLMVIIFYWIFTLLSFLPFHSNGYRFQSEFRKETSNETDSITFKN